MPQPRTVHPLDQWTEEERTRIVAGQTLRREKRRSVDPFIMSGLALLLVIVVGVPIMAWFVGRYVFGMISR